MSSPSSVYCFSSNSTLDLFRPPSLFSILFCIFFSMLLQSSSHINDIWESHEESLFFFNFFFWYIKFLCRNIFLFCLNFLDSFSLHTFELYHPQYYNNCFLKRKKQTKTNNNGINYVYRDAPRYCHLKDYLRKEQTMKYLLGKESIVKSPRNLLLFSEKDSKSMI